MCKEDTGTEPEDHDETLKQEEEVASSTDNGEKDAKNIHEETEEEEKTLEELKEENKTLSDRMMRALNIFLLIFVIWVSSRCILYSINYYLCLLYTSPSPRD